HSGTTELLNLADERNWIDNDAVANDANFAAAQYAGRNQMQNVSLTTMNDGVTGVVAALTANDHVRFGRQDVDDFAFSFVAPLCANQNCVCHFSSKSGKKFSRRIWQDAVGTCPRMIRTAGVGASDFQTRRRKKATKL